MEKNVGEKLRKMNFKEDEQTLFTEILLAVVSCDHDFMFYWLYQLPNVFLFYKKNYITELGFSPKVLWT